MHFYVTRVQFPKLKRRDSKTAGAQPTNFEECRNSYETLRRFPKISENHPNASDAFRRLLKVLRRKLEGHRIFSKLSKFRKIKGNAYLSSQCMLQGFKKITHASLFIPNCTHVITYTKHKKQTPPFPCRFAAIFHNTL